MSSLGSKLLKNTPLVVVLGSTGAGKSKLALELCAKFSGEIISTDSMQVYKGLDIVTNKVTQEERRIAPHHLIDFLSPLKIDYDVTMFRNTALPIIDRLLHEKKLPVIVGGTNYYIEAILWKMLMSPAKKNEKDTHSVTSHESPSHDPIDETSETNRVEVRGPFEERDTVELYAQLVAKDPLAKQRYHPNERRKIIRALEIIENTGELVTDLYKEQHERGRANVSGPLRYPNLCVLWVQSDQKVLDERTDKRVDKMIEQGLIKELQDFHVEYNQQRLAKNEDADYTRGIFQSIGFKEFHDYLVLPDDQKDTQTGKRLLEEGIENMKRVTRRYAKKQSRWVTNRFIRRKGESVPRVYAVDSTQVELWDTNVYQPAEKIVQAFIEGRDPDQAPIPLEERDNEPCYQVCEVCDKVFVRTKAWQEHLSSNKHAKRIASLKRKSERDEAFAQQERGSKLVKNDSEQLQDNSSGDNVVSQEPHALKAKDSNKCVQDGSVTDFKGFADVEHVKENDDHAITT